MPIGIVSVVYGARCEVLEDGASLPCILRGKLKLAAESLVAGDQVEFQRLDAHTAVVERILPRRNELARSSRERPRRRSKESGRGREVEAQSQVVLANPDQVVFVAAARNPGLQLELMDRALALARKANLPAALCVNKMDLAPGEEIQRLMRPYEALGLPVVYVSADERRNLESLHALLGGKLSFFWGGSGVGKSSLIRALTGLEVKVGRWRTDNPRGPHTTNVTRLYPLPGGGLIADTPGFDWLELDAVDDAPDRIGLMLPEAVPLAGRCRFPGCSHCGEAGCAVMNAVLSGEIDRSRYARFRSAVAEFAPARAAPLELLSAEDELFFRMREGNTSVWTTFQLYYLFQTTRPERFGLMEALGVGGGEPLWTVFQERRPGGLASRSTLTAKVTALRPPDMFLREGQELVLRERGTVKAMARVKSVRPAADTWKLRKALKGTAIYEGRPFWSDLKPPRGEPMPPLFGAVVVIDHIDLFEPVPELGLGAITGNTLDYLEVGTSEDELVRQ